jgi:hypothetical protein
MIYQKESKSIYVGNASDTHYLIQFCSIPYHYREGNEVFIDTINAPNLVLNITTGFEVSEVTIKEGGVPTSRLIFHIFPKESQWDHGVYDMMMECANFIDDMIQGKNDMTLEDIEGFFLL